MLGNKTVNAEGKNDDRAGNLVNVVAVDEPFTALVEALNGFSLAFVLIVEQKNTRVVDMAETLAAERAQ